jgi:hypothetical protein
MEQQNMDECSLIENLIMKPLEDVTGKFATVDSFDMLFFKFNIQ